VATGMIFISAFLIGLQRGIVGVAAAYTIASLLLAYPNFAIPLQLIDLSMGDLYDALWRPFAASLIMLAGILLLRFLLPPDLSQAWVLCLLVPVGSIIYLSATWYMNRDQVLELIGVVGGKP